MEDRYARQLVMPEIGVAGQECLARSRGSCCWRWRAWLAGASLSGCRRGGCPGHC